MTVDKKIIDENDINKKAAKISALSSGSIENYEYLAGGELLPPN